MVVDMEVDMVANMELDKMADMKVDTILSCFDNVRFELFFWKYSLSWVFETCCFVFVFVQGWMEWEVRKNFGQIRNDLLSCTQNGYSI